MSFEVPGTRGPEFRSSRVFTLNGKTGYSWIPRDVTVMAGIDHELVEVKMFPKGNEETVIAEGSYIAVPPLVFLGDFYGHEETFESKVREYGIPYVFAGGTDSYVRGNGHLVWHAIDQILGSRSEGAYRWVHDHSRDQWTTKQMRERIRRYNVYSIWQGKAGGKNGFLYYIPHGWAP